MRLLLPNRGCLLVSTFSSSGLGQPGVPTRGAVERHLDSNQQDSCGFMSRARICRQDLHSKHDPASLIQCPAGGNQEPWCRPGSYAAGSCPYAAGIGSCNGFPQVAGRERGCRQIRSTASRGLGPPSSSRFVTSSRMGGREKSSRVVSK